MSWVQLRDEDWGAGSGRAELKLHLARPDAQAERQEWSLEVMHKKMRTAPLPGHGPAEKFLSLTLETLGLDLRDWRDLAGREVRADADWHARHFRPNEYGRLCESSLHVWEHIFADRARGSSEIEREWRAVDFTIRFGQRDGFDFPMELDAWLIPEDQFWRTTPETPEELARFGEGPPDLRLMATAKVWGGWVCLPACDDPLALARRYLREELRFDEPWEPTVQWATRRWKGDLNVEPQEMREWPPTVHFRPKAETSG